MSKIPELKEKCIPTGLEIDLLYQDLTRASKSKFRIEENVEENVELMDVHMPEGAKVEKFYVETCHYKLGKDEKACSL